MLKSIIQKITSGVMAGILISIGGTVFLKCNVSEIGKYVGAVFFCVALICICFKGYSLFTGKVGYLPEKHGKEEFSVLLLGLLGNAIGTIVFGIAMKYAVGVGEVATSICTAKLTQTIWSTLIRAIMCGILMYLAVSIFRDHNKNVIGILFCIPVFILSGFEHSIADIFYFAASDIVSIEAFGYLMLVVVGNAIGGMLLPALKILTEKKQNDKN